MLVIISILLVFITVVPMVTAGFGEDGSSCGTIGGCMNFTMYPGSVKTEPWGIVNTNNYSLDFYVVAPYYGNSSTVPQIIYGVPCLSGVDTVTNTSTYNALIGANITSTNVNQETCVINANSTFTIPVTVAIKPTVPINEQWGDCTTCFSVVYVTQTQSGGPSGASIAIDTAKRVLITVEAKPKLTTTIPNLINPTGGNNTDNAIITSQNGTTQQNHGYTIYVYLATGFVGILGIGYALISTRKPTVKKVDDKPKK